MKYYSKPFLPLKLYRETQIPGVYQTTLLFPSFKKFDSWYRSVTLQGQQHFCHYYFWNTHTPLLKKMFGEQREQAHGLAVGATERRMTEQWVTPRQGTDTPPRSFQHTGDPAGQGGQGAGAGFPDWILVG